MSSVDLPGLRLGAAAGTRTKIRCTHLYLGRDAGSALGCQPAPQLVCSDSCSGATAAGVSCCATAPHSTTAHNQNMPAHSAFKTRRTTLQSLVRFLCTWPENKDGLVGGHHARTMPPPRQALAWLLPAAALSCGQRCRCAASASTGLCLAQLHKALVRGFCQACLKHVPTEHDLKQACSC